MLPRTDDGGITGRMPVAYCIRTQPASGEYSEGAN